MAQANPPKNNPASLLIPVYSSYEAGRLKTHILAIPRAARFAGCDKVVLEIPRSSASAIREVLGPLAFKGLEVMVRYRDFEEGHALWPVPPPIDFEPEARLVKTYRTPTRNPVSKLASKQASKPEADEDEDENQHPDDPGIETSQVAMEIPKPTSAKPSRPPTEQAKPQALDYRGLKLNPQQPIPDNEQDLMGGVKVTRVAKKPKA